MSFPSSKYIEKKEKASSSSLLETTTEHPNSALSPPQEKRDVHDAHDKNDNIQLTTVNINNSFKEREPVSSREEDHRERLIKDTPKTSRNTQSISQKKRNEASRPSFQRPTTTSDNKAISLRRNHQSRSNIRDKSHPNICQSTEIESNTTKQDIRLAHESEPPIPKLPKSTDSKSTYKLKIHHPKSKIKDDSNTSEPLKICDKEGVLNAKENELEVMAKENRSEQNIPPMPTPTNRKDISKTRTNQAKARSTFKPKITRTPESYDSTDISEAKNGLSKSNVKKDNTQDPRLSTNINEKATPWKKNGRSKVKLLKEQIPSQSKMEIDYESNSQIEAENDGVVSNEKRQRDSTTKDKNIRADSKTMTSVRKTENLENVRGKISRLTYKSDTGDNLSLNTNCGSTVKYKSDIPSRPKVTQTKVEKSERPSSLLTSNRQFTSKEKYGEKDENCLAGKRTKYLKTFKQSVSSKEEVIKSNITCPKSSLSQKSKQKQPSEEGNVVKIQSESHDCSNPILYDEEVLGNIKYLSTPNEKESKAPITSEEKNIDDDADLHDQRCNVKDVSFKVVDARVVKSFTKDTFNAKDKVKHGFSFESTVKNKTSMTTLSKVNVLDDYPREDVIEKFGDLAERDIDKEKKDLYEDHKNDKLNRYKEANRKENRLTFKWKIDPIVENGKGSDIDRHGQILEKSKSSITENLMIRYTEEINGARSKYETSLQSKSPLRSNSGKVTEKVTFLENILNKESSVIIEELLKHPSLLEYYTDIGKCDERLLDLFLQVLSMAFVTSDYIVVLQLLEYLKTTGFFEKMFDYLMLVIIDIKSKHIVGEHIQGIVENLLSIQTIYVSRSPSSISTFRKLHVMIGRVIDELVNVETLNEEILVKNQHLSERIKDIEKARKKASLHQEDINEPVDDYRQYSISPTVDEITATIKPCLRQIKATGRYEDLHDYLDIHFRLLREDFVGPLREGISGFIKIMSAYKGKASNSNNIKDLGLKIYDNVRVLSPAVTQQGLCYKMKLKMTDILKAVEWDVSKRLIYGSMVCLTDRNFTEFFLATVVEREVKDIKRGYFIVRFETENISIKSLLNRSFIMAETSGYFEAYRHVLLSLQSIQAGDLPFEKYIVQCERAVSYPEYLKTNTTFDLRPIVEQNVKLKATRHLSETGKVDIAKTVEFSPISYSAKDVRVTDHKHWPCKELLQMNESQYRAVQLALTREFAVIQGPPGTGKTYIGLQIVKVLLQNKSVWTRNGKTSGPMLIVCYTNHALDQFLEGIVKFYEGDIIRVGARSSSTYLEEFNLKKYRKLRFEKGTTLARLQYEKRVARRSMESQSKYVQELAERIQVYQSDIVDEETLSAEIGDRLFDNLTKGYRGKKKRFNFSYIVKWLGIEHMKNECMKEIKSGQSKQKAKYVKVKDETSRTNEERMIDIDEDFYFSSNKRSIIRKIRDENIAFYVKDPVSYKKEKVCSAEMTRAKQLYKTFKTTLMSKITDEDVMSQEEADKIQNLWRINHQEKWRLYRLWIRMKCADLYAKIEEKKANFEAASKRYREASLQVDKAIMKKAVIIGMTTSGAAKYQSVLRDIGPRIIVVEEAAEVLEAHIITTLSKNCKHLILIGDHKQLRPNPTVYELVVKYKLDISLFERMVKNKIDFNCLELQHRMRPEIASVMRHIYPELKDHEHVKSYPNVKGVSTNLFLINHSNLETCSDEIKSYSNYKEAEYTVALCKYLLLQGYERQEITVLTTYTGQLMHLRKLMPKTEFDGVIVTVVDNYQGEENQIIILSLVRSNTNSKIGFLKTENRICVALSRAKMGLYILGNFDHLSTHSSMWEKITKDMKDKGAIGEGLVLYCQNHPDDKAIVARDPEDFQKAPEGGCLKRCNARLECGHVCILYCHVTDRDHVENKCKKPCNKILCDYDHVCPDKCFVECSPCNVLMTKIIPNCGHTQAVPCATPPEEFCCQELCSKLLECGHSCKERCGEEHTRICLEEVYHIWPCGHGSQILCWEAKSKRCPRPCGTELKCKHTCSGTCGTCYMGRVHQQCKHESSDTKLCGHKLSIICQNNLPCSKDCENRCSHKKCTKLCGEVCTPCHLPCDWKCIHKCCTKRCDEICNRTPCNFPCEKILRCKHSCVGLCCEPCPNVCRICNKKKFKSLTFGKKQVQSNNYVLLEQCGHLVEFHLMDAIVNKLTIAKALRCPKCNSVVQSCIRYGNTIKTFRRRIESSADDFRKYHSQWHKLQNSICTVTFENSFDTLTYSEIEKENISAEIAKRKFPTLFYKLLFKKEFGNRLDVLYKSPLIQTQQLMAVEKQWIIANEIVVFIQHILDMERELNEPFNDNSLVSFLHQLVNIVVQPRDVLTDQEDEDFRREIQRAKAYVKFLKTKKLSSSVNISTKICDDFKTVQSALIKSSRFTNDIERVINGSIVSLTKEMEEYIRQKNIACHTEEVYVNSM